MDKLFGSLKSFLKIPQTVIDNGIFRLHYKVTVCALLAFSLLVSSKQHFGDPISCISKDDIPSQVLDTYCWVHATFSIKNAWEKKVGDEIPYPGVDTYTKGDQKVHHAYYQWVCFVLFLQANLFYFPRRFWKNMENGRVKTLVQDLNNPILPDDKKRSSIAYLVEYFTLQLHRHDEYYYYYLFSEAMNVANVIGQIYLIDRFLGGEFSSFGTEVVKFTAWDFDLRFDPMIKVFPRLTKCTFHRYGSSGDVQKHDAMCLLPINIINEKIFIFLWFWFVILAVVSCCALAYRVLMLMSSDARMISLSSRAGLVSRDNYETVLTKIKIGDWFLLTLLQKNLYPIHFKDFMQDLKDKLEDRKSFKGA